MGRGLEQLEDKLCNSRLPVKHFLRNRLAALTLFCLTVYCIHRQGALLGLQDHENIRESEDWRTYPVGKVAWEKCTEYGIRGTECGYIIVPTDYTDPSAGVTKVALARYNATKLPRQGMVLALVNLGGPGEPGNPFVVFAADRLQSFITGESYDIIGFDPRGTGDTRPRTECFRPGQSEALKRNTVLSKGFDLAGDVDSSTLRQSLLRQQVEADALYQVQYGVCEKEMGNNLRYMGTTTVARDLDFITTVLEGKEALINFYGVSYGSILGQYLVNMFPDRVGRVAMDGIIDASTWADTPNYKWYRQWLTATEMTYNLFLYGCSRAHCALANHTGESPRVIRGRIEEFFNKLYEHPLPVIIPGRPDTLTVGMARARLFEYLQFPALWSFFSGVLAAAIDTGHLLPLYSAPSMTQYRDMERQAVSCTDAADMDVGTAPSNEEIVDELLDVAKTQTKFAFSVITTQPDSGCQYWPVVPSERFHGPWNQTLRNSILIVSPAVDPLTGLAAASKVRSRLGKSAALLFVDVPGHTALHLPSVCMTTIYRAYFKDGVLPHDRHVCSVDRQPFPMKDTDETLSGGAVASVSSSFSLGDVMVGLQKGFDLFNDFGSSLT